MKPGWQTSEFWLSVLVIVAASILAAFSFLTSTEWTGAIAAAVAGYNLSRGIAKAAPPKPE